MKQGIPLTMEDRAILDLEGPDVAGHTLKVVVIGAPGITVEEMRSRIGERIAAAPELSRRLGGGPDRPFWESDPDFSLSRHVGPLEAEGELDEAGLRRVAASLFARRLDRSLPLWRIDVAAMRGGGTALFWRVHHVMADGTTTMRLAKEILWDPRERVGETGNAQEGEQQGRQAAGSTADRTDAEPARARSDESRAADEEDRRRRHVLGLFEREFARSPSRSPFDGRIGKERTVAFAAVPLGDLHDAAKTLAGATLNDAVLAVVAGGIRSWLDLGEDPDSVSIRVKVPVSLHRAGDGVANRDSFFYLPLPLGEPDPVRRLTAITDATRVRKADHDAEDLDLLLKRLSGRSKRLARLLDRLERSPRRFAFSVSNVKGPRGELSVSGAPVESMHTVVEIAEHHALRIAVLSLGDRLYFGFCADRELVSGLDEMSAGAEAEAALLVSLAAGPA